MKTRLDIKPSTTEPDWAAIRSRFPVLDKKTYLNSCAYRALITLRTHDKSALVASLEDEGIVTSCRFENLRIAPHFYNNHDDIDTLFRALKRQKHLLI